MSLRVNGSTAALNFPTRLTCIPMPYFSNMPVKNSCSEARPGMESDPNGSMVITLAAEAT